MKHFAGPEFWKSYDKLPTAVQGLANEKFELLKENPRHPSLHLKRVGEYWSVRVGRRYRALAIEVDKGLFWFWIGTHGEYDQILK